MTVSSDITAGGGAAAGNDSRLRDLLSALTLEEKVLLLTGRDFFSTHPMERIGLRRMVLSDGPSGVRGERWDERDPSLCLPSTTALAASWDPMIARRYGAALAVEARHKGADVVLGPTVNLHRSPLGGRNFEAFSEDPVLTAELAAAYVSGMQANGVAAAVKHYVANDYETGRFTASSEVSQRALRELYLLAFEKTVTQAHAWLVMSAYNSINGVTATENELLETPLNSQWGFDGVVVSDWAAVRSIDSARHAQDLVMPGPDGPWGGALVAAVRAGDIPAEAVDRKVLRLLRLATSRPPEPDRAAESPRHAGHRLRLAPGSRLSTPPTQAPLRVVVPGALHLRPSNCADAAQRKIRHEPDHHRPLLRRKNHECVRRLRPGSDHRP
jgi:beta-glucosidase